MNIKTYIILIPLLLIAIEVFAQNNAVNPTKSHEETLDSMEMKPMYGIFGGYSINFHSTNFRNLPGVPSCCPKFSYGQGGGYYFGGLIDYPINYDMLLSAQFYFNHFNGKLTTYEETPILLDGKDANPLAINQTKPLQLKLSSSKKMKFFFGQTYKQREILLSIRKH